MKSCSELRERKEANIFDSLLQGTGIVPGTRTAPLLALAPRDDMGTVGSYPAVLYSHRTAHTTGKGYINASLHFTHVN